LTSLPLGTVRTNAPNRHTSLPALGRHSGVSESGFLVFRGSGLGEQNTKATLIEPVLRAVGWDVEDVEEVHREYRRVPADNPVDYALRLARTPRLFVEAKGLDENLEDRRWTNQMIAYATASGVEWMILTNGDEYRIYNALAAVPLEEKLFRAIRITSDLEDATQALALISKQQTEQNSLAILWRTFAIDQQVRTAVNALFSPEPSPWLVRRLARGLDGLTPRDIAAALERARVRLDFPEQDIPNGRSRSGQVPTQERARPATRRTSRRPPTSIPVSIMDLIRAGLLRPPMEVKNTYLRRELTARIEPDGRISFDGELYDSLSTAAGMARASLRPPPSGRRYPQTNGWTFWKFRDSDGQMREMAALRQRFLEGASEPRARSR
jgi:hypothetical protein